MKEKIVNVSPEGRGYTESEEVLEQKRIARILADMTEDIGENPSPEKRNRYVKKEILTEIDREFLSDIQDRRKAFSVPDEFFIDPKIQKELQHRVSNALFRGDIDFALQFKNADFLQISEESFQKALNEAIDDCLDEAAMGVIAELKERFAIPDDLIQKKYKKELIKKLSEGKGGEGYNICRLLNGADLIGLSKKASHEDGRIQEVAKEGLPKIIENGMDLYYFKQIVERLGLLENFTLSPEIKTAFSNRVEKMIDHDFDNARSSRGEDAVPNYSGDVDGWFKNFKEMKDNFDFSNDWIAEVVKNWAKDKSEKVKEYLSQEGVFDRIAEL